MTVKLNFADFWEPFDKEDNYFTQLLSQHYTIEISDNPDFLIYSCYGRDHLKYSCFKIFYNGENLRVNWNACDFAFSFDYIENPCHFRLPNWVLYGDLRTLLLPKKDLGEILKGKTGFCNMVVSNPHASKRIEFFKKLSKYKKVDSGGRYLNNIGGPIADKRSFIRGYKFTIAFENSSYPGYTTEKLVEPMFENSIPIYWGNPLVGRDFNTSSFINFHDYINEQAVIEKIVELDQNDDLYKSMLGEPWYKNGMLPSCIDSENILKQFRMIFAAKGTLKPAAQTYRKHIYSLDLQLQRVDGFLNRKLQYRKHFR